MTMTSLHITTPSTGTAQVLMILTNVLTSGGSGPIQIYWCILGLTKNVWKGIFCSRKRNRLFSLRRRPGVWKNLIFKKRGVCWLLRCRMGGGGTPICRRISSACQETPCFMPILHPTTPFFPQSTLTTPFFHFHIKFYIPVQIANFHVHSSQFEKFTNFAVICQFWLEIAFLHTKWPPFFQRNLTPMPLTFVLR